MSTQAIFEKYLRALFQTAQQGDAREESYYGVLASALMELAKSTDRSHLHVTTLPKSTDAGNPDFRIWNGKDRIVGYIEAKKPTEEKLDQIEDSEQLRRYRATFPNLVLTNFLEFRLYRNGERVQTAQLARPFVLNFLQKSPPLQKPDDCLTLLDLFLSFSLPRTFTAASLAAELAKRTRFLRQVVSRQLAEEEEKPAALTGFYEAFKQYLIGHLSKKDFSNLYAQTIAYGLFAARTRAVEREFSRRTAFNLIPHTIGVLRDLFRFISLDDLPIELEWTVDDIAEVLAVADAPGILDAYYKKGKGSDPIVHFYETFLSEYDPDERERRGVYYTPEPVVSYIVRSLHQLLKREFGQLDGLASEGVTLLDPAAGTMTFIAHAAREAVREFESKYGRGAREEFIRRQILPNFNSFELMMAPYAVGHLKISFFLEELGHRLADDERVRFYLTNTLDMEELAQSRLPGLSSLAEESHHAIEVKKQTPILVILGNPPYSGQSANRSEEEIVIPKGRDYVSGWKPDPKGGAVPVKKTARREFVTSQPTFIGRLVRDYFFVDGKPLGEKNPKWLHNDYVKFLRFAQWKIEQAGHGLVGMITDNGYLDNPTFRGMRQNLLRTFDEIYVLDLHGNARKRETCEDGSPDENVFDILQGVAIVLLVKRGHQRSQTARVHHAEQLGKRESKYTWLEEHDFEHTTWQELQPGSESYLFVPQDRAKAAQYESFIAMDELFPVSSVGIVTARDSLTIHWTPEKTWTTVRVFSGMDPELARQGYKLGKDTRDWQVHLAQQDLLDSGPVQQKVVTILYRPFDVRYTYYTGRSRGFICMPRPEVMRHMLTGDNLALIVPKQCKDDFGALVARTIGGHKSVAAYDINYYFPLYLHPEPGRRDLLSPLESSERRPNINQAVFDLLAMTYPTEPSPEDILHYSYATLYAPSYREKYQELLRRGFPRIPFPKNYKIFQQMAAAGERLKLLHLLESPELDPPLARFENIGGDPAIQVGKQNLHYDEGEQRIYLNGSQYFSPVPELVWRYKVGGYQVCAKWLKDRCVENRALDLDDIRTFCRIVTALSRTIEIQNEINSLYPQIEMDGWISGPDRAVL